MISSASREIPVATQTGGQAPRIAHSNISMSSILRTSRRIGCFALAFATLHCSGQERREIYDPKGESAQAGFVDIDLHIDDLDCKNWASCSVKASGIFRGSPVAVEVQLQGQDGAGQGRITYRSVGPASDALIRSLAALYKTPVKGLTFSGAASADIVFLDANARAMSGKVFFSASGPEADYAELYTNIDKQRRVLEIHEKDPEYRKNVIKGLSR